MSQLQDQAAIKRLVTFIQSMQLKLRSVTFIQSMQLKLRSVTFIQSIQLKLRSDLLIMKHGKRTHIAEENTVFVNGQAIAIKGGPYIGSEAFNRLSPWDTGQFSFVTHHPSPVPHFKPIYTNAIASSPVTSNPDMLRNTRPISHELDRRTKSTHTQPLPPLFPPTSTPEHLNGRTKSTHTQPLPPLFPPTSTPEHLNGRTKSTHTQPLPPLFPPTSTPEHLNGRTKSTHTQPLPPLFPPTSTPEHLNGRTKVPQPSRSFSTALQLMDLMSFSRAHRRIFLLIDGKRSIDELARLIGYTPKEVSELLHDLEEANLF